MGLLSVQGQRYLSLQEVPEPCGNTHPVIAPYGTFDTADGPLNLAPATQAMWTKLCSILNLADLPQDLRFLSNAERMQNRHVLKDVLETALKQKTRMEWTSIMIENGIPAGPINTLDDVFNDAQVLACDLVETVEHPVVGPLKQVALPVKMGSMEGEPSVRTAPPLFGEHTRDVFANYGFSHDQIEQLIASKVIHQAA